MTSPCYLSPVEAPTLAEVQAWPGPVLLHFGTDWCGHCRRALPLVLQALADQPGVRHVLVEDGSGRALGRAFQVKLWPTLVLLRDGVPQARLVRPQQTSDVANALQAVLAGPGSPGAGQPDAG